ncbi:MAG: phosphotransferase, partial [Saprospiraceae bacterium]|nr:phosphotransferase [Saprospiraceae bacterium]
MVLENQMISEEEVRELAWKYYQFDGQISALPGEVDFNFRLKNKDEDVTLKITRAHTDPQYIDFQVAIIKHLSEGGFPLQIPEIIPVKDGRDYVDLGNGRFLRLQKWVPGMMLDEVIPRSHHLLEAWGRTAGMFSKYLTGFDHPGAHRQQKWNPSETLALKKYHPYFQTEEQKEIADYFWDLFEKTTLPQLPALRKSVNYNDAHEHNLLVSGSPEKPEINGVID